MSNVMGTSQWINFFRKAGLPPNVAANYAIIFSDNRIQVGMLLDLSKEYLYDMGIKVMGDVIAILKYAKEFHNQLVKEKMIGYVSPAVTANKAVAERLVGHYTRSSPIRSPVVPTERGMNSKKSTIINLKRKANVEGEHVKKIRRVPPEEEGAYKIKMPLGITERTRKILKLQHQVSQAGSKRSVFTRLGDSAVSSSTDSKVSSSVFERLGPSSKIICDDMPSSTVSSDFERPRIKGTPLSYRGVLKMTVGKKRTVMATAPKQNITLSRTVIKPGVGKPNIVKTIKLNKINSILEGRKSSTLRIGNPLRSQGIFGQGIVTQKMNIKSRLGDKMEAQNLTRTKILLPKKGSPVKSQSNVFSRLGL